MASSVSSEKIFSRHCLQAGVHAPNTTNAQVCTGLSYVDLRDYDGFGVLALQTKLNTSSNGMTLVEIVAAADASGTSVQVIKTSGAVNCANSNLNDYVALECTADEIEQIGVAAGVALRYVAARITMDNANSTAAVTYVRYASKRPGDALTASVTG